MWHSKQQLLLLLWGRSLLQGQLASSLPSLSPLLLRLAAAAGLSAEELLLRGDAATQETQQQLALQLASQALLLLFTEPLLLHFVFALHCGEQGPPLSSLLLLVQLLQFIVQL